MFPLVMKNRMAYARVSNPAVPITVVVSEAEQLVEWARGFDGSSPVVLQEFVPRGRRVNWIYQAYRSADGQRILSFTGIKQRDWPSGRGETTMALSVSNPGLKSILDSFLQAIDYRGVCGLDVVLDRRTRKYSVIDFNPRFGANAGLFVTAEGVSLVGAYHLDLTGREFPIGRQVDGRSFQVEPRDRFARREAPAGAGPRRGRELAYWARDDPAPMVMERVRTTVSTGRARMSRRWSNDAR